MERITYRKTLDVHKNGVQFLLQGFETADNMSRVIEISLMASGDAIDFPLERMVAMMYVTTPNATEPSINECTIKDNKVVYDVLPIVEEGITTMQIKLIETSPEGATSVLASPKFAVEVTKSGADDGSAEQSATFTALEDAMAKAKAVYDERFLRMELTSDCIFRAYYADGTLYETDVLQKLFLNGNVLLSESFAHGGTGVRAGEDTDNSKYYSNVARSEALRADEIMTDSEEILEEVKLHGVYTAFSVDFETGEVEYVSPSFKFNVNLETGELDAEGQTYTFDDEIGRVVEAWLGERGVMLSDLQEISSQHSEEIGALQETVETHSTNLEALNSDVKGLLDGAEHFFAGAQFVKVAEFNEAGSYTWIPSEEDLLARFIIVGAGAGGGTPEATKNIGAKFDDDFVGHGGGGGAVIISDIISLKAGMNIPVVVGAGGIGAEALPWGTDYYVLGGDGGSSSCMDMVAPGAKGDSGGEMPTRYLGWAWAGASEKYDSAPSAGRSIDMMSPLYPYETFSASGSSGGEYNGYRAHDNPSNLGGTSSIGNGGTGGYSTSLGDPTASPVDPSALNGTDGANGCGGGGGGYFYDEPYGLENQAVTMTGNGGNGGDGYVAIYALKKVNNENEE